MMRKLTITLLSLAMFLPAMAQEMLGDIELEEVPEIRRYTVEVIVFRYAQEVMTGSEIFLPDEPEPEMLPLDEDIDFVEEPPEEPGEELEPLPDAELVVLDEADFQLGDIMDRMKRLDIYEPIMHFGWTQATWPNEQTDAIPLHRLALPPAGLDGELTLYLGRYLHLVVDLQLRATDFLGINQDEVEQLGDVTVSDLLNGIDAQPGELPAYYRIQENRILKNGELRYYDHPKFGVLAKVTRVEDEEAESGEAELLGYGSE
jgi:hypothetical protein